MDPIFIVGITAATLTTAAFLPQVAKAHQSRHTKDLSLSMFIVLAIGVSLWIVYGVALGSIPVIAANSVTLCLMLYLVYLKIKYG
ncbi:MAG: SemiSWEET transporter [Candidatus Margulisbacteria bacterium]|nr:SemiSWEET transporter [Candidatus Margulisiibacteriota bacterium]